MTSSHAVGLCLAVLCLLQGLVLSETTISNTSPGFLDEAAEDEGKVEVVVTELSLDEVEQLVLNTNYALDIDSMRVVAQDLIRRIRELQSRPPVHVKVKPPVKPQDASSDVPPQSEEIQKAVPEEEEKPREEVPSPPSPDTTATEQQIEPPTEPVPDPITPPQETDEVGQDELERLTRQLRELQAKKAELIALQQRLHQLEVELHGVGTDPIQHTHSAQSSTADQSATNDGDKCLLEEPQTSPNSDYQKENNKEKRKEGKEKKKKPKSKKDKSKGKSTQSEETQNKEGKQQHSSSSEPVVERVTIEQTHHPQQEVVEIEVEEPVGTAPGQQTVHLEFEATGGDPVFVDPMRLAAKMVEVTKEEQQKQAQQREADTAFQHEIKAHLKKIVQNSINTLLAKWADSGCPTGGEDCGIEQETPHFACFSTIRGVMGMFDIEERKWLEDSKLEEISKIRRDAAAVGTPTEATPHIMFLGGKADDETYSADVVLLNLDTLKTTPEASLPVPLWGHRAIQFTSGAVLVCGGKTKPNGPSRRECCVLKSDTGICEPGPAMSIARSSFSLVASRDRKHLFVIGGVGENNELLSSVETLEIDGGQDGIHEWKPLIANTLVDQSGVQSGVALPVAAAGIGCVVLSTKEIICAGGRTDKDEKSARVWALNMRSPPPKWVELPELKYGDGFSTVGQLVAIAGELYAVGDIAIQSLNLAQRDTWEYVSWRGCKQPAVGAIL